MKTPQAGAELPGAQGSGFVGKNHFFDFYIYIYILSDEPTQHKQGLGLVVKGFMMCAKFLFYLYKISQDSQITCSNVDLKSLLHIHKSSFCMNNSKKIYFF